MTKHHTKSLFRYAILGHTLTLVEQHMYLSVKLDYRLSWRPHIGYVCNKANKLLRFLKRNLQSCPKYFWELSCKQFIIPVLEYCAPIWDPYHLSDINKIEMIQHRAARFVLKKPWRRSYRDSVSSMLADLQWEHYQSGMISLQEFYNVNHLTF